MFSVEGFVLFVSFVFASYCVQSAVKLKGSDGSRCTEEDSNTHNNNNAMAIEANGYCYNS